MAKKTDKTPKKVTAKNTTQKAPKKPAKPAARAAQAQPKKTVKPAASKVSPKKPAKPAVLKTTGKKATPKASTPKKTVKPAASKASVAKQSAGQKKSNKPATPKLKKLMHDENFELGAGGDKPIIIRGKAAQPKRTQKVLRRVARTGGYTAWDARTGKTFATEKEANDYAADVLKKTGKIVPVSPTDRQVTYTFKAEQTNK